MSRTDFSKALRAARYVFVWVNVYGDEGEYVQVSKESMKRALQRDWEIRAELRANGDLYVG